MDAELRALAATGAVLLVETLAGEGWARARALTTRFFERAGQPVEWAGEVLDRSRADLLAVADGEERRLLQVDLANEWDVRLGRALRRSPQSAVELRALLTELRPEEDDTAPGSVHNTVNTGTQHGVVIQGDGGGSAVGSRLTGSPGEAAAHGRPQSGGTAGNTPPGPPFDEDDEW
ncbi:hypothetical protein [Streptomyces sp. SCSIO ZS0520]|uniref:hypothetical protein n=1 Tax=Streptomyces sp. SCSIO ZS0520 TaxID=2892996 RepID=UPI0021DB43DD|nr:hypothetical protein [Streptomyces sp. SCSIO ZS0520]